MFLKVKLLFAGLDPANPMMSHFVGCYLTSDDAEWVDVIHSDMYAFGTAPSQRMAKIHIFVNGGCRYQPPNCTVLPATFNPSNNQCD